MKSIFFDLETTDLNPCGQIINFSFMTVDENWNVESEHNGSIHISRLQLPNPYAILANRVNVVEHQRAGYSSEAEAMPGIRKYIQSVIDTSRESVNLIGFNSNRFDVPFLRTSMIRNGVNPYFGRSLIYKDVLHVAQKLALIDSNFLDMVATGEVTTEGNREFSLRLFHLSKIFFGETQIHESSDDVRLTIMLAQLFAEEYDLDIRIWDSYEASNFNSALIKEFPAFDAKHHRDSTDKFARETLIHYQSDKKYSLWISLERLKELKNRQDELKEELGEKLFLDSIDTITRDDVKNCVLWFNKNSSSFYVSSDIPLQYISEEDENLVKNAKSIVDDWDITVKNYWPNRNCDIECFIYNLSFNGMDALAEAIHDNDLGYLERLDEDYANILYKRHVMNSFSNPNHDSVKKALNGYALYRYGGRMKTSKIDTESVFDEGIYNPSFHATYNELVDIIDGKLSTPGVTIEDALLLESLKKFYDESPMSAGGVDKVHQIKKDV